MQLQFTKVKVWKILTYSIDYYYSNNLFNLKIFKGMTLDAAHVQLADAFCSGQAYVALSRVRSLEKLSIIGLPTSFQTDPRVIEYYRDLEARSSLVIGAANVSLQRAVFMLLLIASA